ncbi:MAG: hypothetical protein LKI34_02785 [Bifidobacterium tibiigranuli]|jgi:hypothetical protein|uniref:hypothetical protein n=1 Tax=Bifidobacterium tibiigranuli TaxID=2172043 RepID=UPI0026EB1591|nr:hypothetical protein [Bifidobacterium tibiigranuli]MCI1673132.1 hypothetical protein [Bifidobacterium tibiigranuli]MCI1713623.1 hypothetical protein [Bifidobacterium tibiigranuli]
MSSIRHNWFPSPTSVFARTPDVLLDGTVQPWGSQDNPGIALFGSNSTGPYVKWLITGLVPNQQVALSATAGLASSTDVFRGALIELRSSGDQSLAASPSWANQSRLRVAATVPSDGILCVVMRGKQGAGAATAFYRVILTEAGGDESFFTGADMPAIFGGGGWLPRSS